MSGPDDPRRERPDEDDPFAFAPDDRDARERGSASAGSTDPDAGVDAGDDADPQARPGAPDGAPPTSGPDAGAGPEDDDAAERERAAARARLAEEAAARRALLGAEASRTAQAASSRWLLVGVLLLLVVAVASTLLAGRGGDDGQVRPGERLPAFAAPLATRPRLAQDFVNLAQRDDQGQAGRYAACSITEPSAVTSCGLLRRGPLVLVVFSRGVDVCLRAVDDVEAAGRALSGVGTLAVATNTKHGEAAETVSARRWRLPVVYDRDGALASRLGAAVCPLVLFVRRDGSVADRLVGDDVTADAVRTRAARLRQGGAAASSPAAPATSSPAAPTSSAPPASSPPSAAPDGR